jgi:parallel beta-helix repeat protein
VLKAVLLFCLAAKVVVAQAPVVELRHGLVITKSVRIAKRVYDLRAHPSIDSAVIVIRGNDITVDFNGAELRGAPLNADPDAGAGVAIRVEGGRNVRIRNARVRGYRVGLMAIGTRGLEITNNDMSHNWKPRLFSIVEHESLVDWMSYHKNEQREWLRFGAGIYLDGVTGGELRGNRVEQGMNGLMLTRSDSLRIHDNVFSYNSALGVALYRSSYNTIVNNEIDYDVRGYSHGFFRRGQDSAGLLMYEQSSHNVVAWNSVTHGGDGLFLWAGQSTMDTGQGGANDNLFVGNDFSFAPTNGMEATFSRNDFIGNRIEGSDHGLWGGYSFESRVIGNCFARNRIGIAIEHGQDNTISANHFDGDSTGVSLWANAIEPGDWGYPKHRDTKSRDYKITRNRFAAPKEALKILNTTSVDTSANEIATTPTASCDPALLVPADVWASLAPRLPAGRRVAPVAAAARRLRSDIVVDEWGPFDWRSPKLWPIDSTRARPLRLRVLGPSGNWRVIASRGARASRQSGRVGDTLIVSPDSVHDWSVTLEYRGGATVSPRGERQSAGRPYRFSYDHFEPALNWAVRFFRWSAADSAAGKLTTDAFDALLRGQPLLMRNESRLDYMWYRPTIRELPQARFAAEATTSVTLPAGQYTLRTISDDAVRVWIDGVLAIDNWTPHESAVDSAPLTGGRHDIRVQYVQVDGWSELRVEILRGTQRSSGSAGPH